MHGGLKTPADEKKKRKTPAEVKAEEQQNAKAADVKAEEQKRAKAADVQPVPSAASISMPDDPHRNNLTAIACYVQTGWCPKLRYLLVVNVLPEACKGDASANTSSMLSDLRAMTAKQMKKLDGLLADGCCPEIQGLCECILSTFWHGLDGPLKQAFEENLHRKYPRDFASKLTQIPEPGAGSQVQLVTQLEFLHARVFDIQSKKSAKTADAKLGKRARSKDEVQQQAGPEKRCLPADLQEELREIGFDQSPDPGFLTHISPGKGPGDFLLQTHGESLPPRIALQEDFDKPVEFDVDPKRSRDVNMNVPHILRSLPIDRSNLGSHAGDHNVFQSWSILPLSHDGQEGVRDANELFRLRCDLEKCPEGDAASIRHLEAEIADKKENMKNPVSYASRTPADAFHVVTSTQHQHKMRACPASLLRLGEEGTESSRTSSLALFRFPQGAAFKCSKISDANPNLGTMHQTTSAVRLAIIAGSKMYLRKGVQVVFLEHTGRANSSGVKDFHSGSWRVASAYGCNGVRQT